MVRCDIGGEDVHIPFLVLYTSFMTTSRSSCAFSTPSPLPSPATQLRQLLGRLDLLPGLDHLRRDQYLRLERVGAV